MVVQQDVRTVPGEAEGGAADPVLKVESRHLYISTTQPPLCSLLLGTTSLLQHVRSGQYNNITSFLLSSIILFIQIRNYNNSFNTSLNLIYIVVNSR